MGPVQWGLSPSVPLSQSLNREFEKGRLTGDPGRLRLDVLATARFYGTGDLFHWTYPRRGPCVCMHAKPGIPGKVQSARRGPHVRRSLQDCFNTLKAATAASIAARERAVSPR